MVLQITIFMKYRRASRIIAFVNFLITLGLRIKQAVEKLLTEYNHKDCIPLNRQNGVNNFNLKMRNTKRKVELLRGKDEYKEKPNDLTVIESQNDDGSPPLVDSDDEDETYDQTDYASPN